MVRIQSLRVHEFTVCLVLVRLVRVLLTVRGDFSNSIDKCVADTVRALIGCRTTFYNEAARGDIYFTQSVVRARVSEAPVDLLGRERRATA